MSESFPDQGDYDKKFWDMAHAEIGLELSTSTPEVLESYVALLRKNGFNDEEVKAVLEYSGVEGYDVSTKGGE